MDYRSREDAVDMPASLSYNPPPIRVSAFSKPSPPPTSTRTNGTELANKTPVLPTIDPDLTPTPITISSPPITITSPRTTTAGSSSSTIKYRECLRNHAASVGGHVLDGCCEFMPTDADVYKCAACGCHRSFHRKESEGDPDSVSYYQRNRVSVPLLLPPPHPSTHIHHHNHHTPNLHHVMTPKQFGHSGFPTSPVMAFGGNNSGSGATTESSSEERMDNTVAGAPQPMVVSKKRFRTKFTEEQKEKMLKFAESVGWRFQKQDEAMVEQFCMEVGVKRQVLKVWMHNNKHSLRKQQQQQNQQQQQTQLQQQQQTQQQQQQSLSI